LEFKNEPKNLYEPIQYILSLGGKRLRPVLTLMSAEVFDIDCQKALAAATAVEVFHNFSLIHDDIMDDAPLRRGNKTVHEKWNINTGILSGDAMLILAYQYFEEKTKGTLEAGKLADLVILEANPLKVEPMTIKDIKVLETLKAGKSIYKAQ
jgi:geranylgeranyl diphosphate synthase type II